MYEKLTEGDDIKRTKEDIAKIRVEIKISLSTSFKLTLVRKILYHLYINTENGVAHKFEFKSKNKI